MGTPSSNSVLDQPGLRIFDVSEVHDRVAAARRSTMLSELQWPEASIPQVAEPFTRDGHDYVLEVDEFSDLFGDGLTVQHRRPGRRCPDHQRRRPAAARTSSPASGSRCTSPRTAPTSVFDDPGAPEPARRLRRPLLLGADARQPADRGVLDDRAPACGSSTSATSSTRARSATSTSPARAAATRCRSRRGTSRTARSGTPTPPAGSTSSACEETRAPCSIRERSQTSGRAYGAATQTRCRPWVRPGERAADRQ